MKFEISHSFDAPPERVAEVTLDQDFQASLKDIGRLKDRKVLSQKKSGANVVRRTRCVLDIHLGGMAKKMLGDSEPAWVELATWDPERLRWRWEIEPEVGEELLSAFGEMTLEQDGSGTTRTVRGDVRVSVPIYGGRVENTIVEGLRDAYDEEAERISEWLGREKV